MELVKKIDIHAHAVAFPEYYPPYLRPEQPQVRFVSAPELLEHYDRLNIEKGILLAISSPEAQLSPMTSEACKYLTVMYPGRFEWCCNVDPRAGSNSPETDLSHFLRHYQALGAKGVGELTSNLYADSPMVDNLFARCAELDMPVTIHISPKLGRGYGIVDELGLPRIEKMLKKHPKLKIVGHSQPFWAEISGDLTEEKRNGYPTGKVVEGALTRLMRECDNLYCDLSAGSGANAMMRDPEHAAKFMEEFSDRIMYGCDICTKGNTHQYDFDAFLTQMVETGALSMENYKKIVRENAIRVFKIEVE